MDEKGRCDGRESTVVKRVCVAAAIAAGTALGKLIVSAGARLSWTELTAILTWAEFPISLWIIWSATGETLTGARLALAAYGGANTIYYAVLLGCALLHGKLSLEGPYFAGRESIYILQSFMLQILSSELSAERGGARYRELLLLAGAVGLAICAYLFTSNDGPHGWSLYLPSAYGAANAVLLWAVNRRSMGRAASMGLFVFAASLSVRPLCLCFTQTTGIEAEPEIKQILASAFYFGMCFKAFVPAVLTKAVPVGQATTVRLELSSFRSSITPPPRASKAKGKLSCS